MAIGHTWKDVLTIGRAHNVVGLDNYSKYGRVTRSYDGHPNYKSLVGDFHTFFFTARRIRLALQQSYTSGA